MEISKELMESYLTNKLSADQRQAFEANLASDIDLQKEVKLQDAIIESIKQARAAELKSVLNNVNIESVPLLSTQSKVGIGAVILGAMLLFFYFYPEKKEMLATTKEHLVGVDTKDVSSGGAQPKEVPSPAAAPKEKLQKPIAPKVSKINAAPTVQKRTPIEVLDPSKEFETTTTAEVVMAIPEKNIISLANITVENDISDKRYTFHYKFHKGKLILYGTFDSSLYEILEINGEKKTVFLYYKEQYYLLDENQKKIKMLEAIQDGTLLQKLNEYRLSRK